MNIHTTGPTYTPPPNLAGYVCMYFRTRTPGEWLQTHSVAEDSLELLILLSHPASWYDRHELPCYHTRLTQDLLFFFFPECKKARCYSCILK